jgi:hypothetical protein
MQKRTAKDLSKLNYKKKKRQSVTFSGIEQLTVTWVIPWEQSL